MTTAAVAAENRGDMTTSEIDRETEEQESKVIRLTGELNDLKAEQKRALSSQWETIADGKSGALADLKQQIRDRAADIDAHTGAIDVVKQRISALRKNRKPAEIREEEKNTESLVTDAEVAIDRVVSTLHNFLENFMPLYREAQSKISEANYADAKVKELRGYRRPEMGWPDRISFSRDVRIIVETIAAKRAELATEQQVISQLSSR